MGADLRLDDTRLLFTVCCIRIQKSPTVMSAFENSSRADPHTPKTRFAWITPNSSCQRLLYVPNAVIHMPGAETVQKHSHFGR